MLKKKVDQLFDNEIFIKFKDFFTQENFFMDIFWFSILANFIYTFGLKFIALSFLLLHTLSTFVNSKNNNISKYWVVFFIFDTFNYNFLIEFIFGYLFIKNYHKKNILFSYNHLDISLLNEWFYNLENKTYINKLFLLLLKFYSVNCILFNFYLSSVRYLFSKYLLIDKYYNKYFNKSINDELNNDQLSNNNELSNANDELNNDQLSNNNELSNDNDELNNNDELSNNDELNYDELLNSILHETFKETTNNLDSIDDDGFIINKKDN